MSRDLQFSFVLGGHIILPIQEIERNDIKGPRFRVSYGRISVTLRCGITSLTKLGGKIQKQKKKKKKKKHENLTVSRVCVMKF